MITKKELFKGYMALIYALVLLFELINNFTGRLTEAWRFFYAFTQQSNILVLIWLILYGITRFKSLKIKKIIDSQAVIVALTVFISITYFIVALLLNPIYAAGSNPLSSTSELLLHHLTPIVMWIYFFIARGTTETNYKKACYVMIYPVIYLLLNIVIGETVTYHDGTKAYAYGFTNPNSYSNIIIFIGVMIILAVVFGLFSILLTKLKKKIDILE